MLDKVLLSRIPGAMRGVEVFNLHLLKDLAGMGYSIIVPCHQTWCETIAGVSRDGVEAIDCGCAEKPLLNGLLAVWRLRHRRFDVLYLGNVANGLIPAVRGLQLLGVVNRCVLVAHREPSKRFVASQKKMPTTVLAVNKVIAGHFIKAGYTKVDVFFGLPDAEVYFPSKDSAERPGLDLCVVGYLDNAWKGADTAIQAVRCLSEDIKGSVKLHLVSYKSPPEFKETNIIPYAWMPLDSIPGLLRNMDVMIVPSRDEEVMRETFCLAAVQGMLTGLPLIVSDLPVLIEKVENGGGIIFKSVDDLARIIERLHADRALLARLSVEARQIALQQFVWKTEVFVEKYLFPRT